MKRLPPAIQEDYRYLKFEVNGPQKDIGEVVSAIWNSTLNYLGTEGVSDADIWVIGNKFDEKNQEGIIKVKNSREDEIRGALVLNNGFKDETFLSITDVSGTLSGLKE